MEKSIVVKIIAERWNGPILVQIGGKVHRLPNWYFIDHKFPDYDNFTWGYKGTGCVCTAYSILREIYGKDIAEEASMEFVMCYVAMLDEKKGFTVTSEQIDKMLWR